MTQKERHEMYKHAYASMRKFKAGGICSHIAAAGGDCTQSPEIDLFRHPLKFRCTYWVKTQLYPSDFTKVDPERVLQTRLCILEFCIAMTS